MNIKVLSVFLIILYIILVIYIINYKEREHFIDIIDIFSKISSTPNDKRSNMKLLKIAPPKSKIKYIFIEKNNVYYYFYNKNLNEYMSLKYNINNSIKNMMITDLKNENIGYIKNEIYNKIIISLNIYENNDIIIEYLNNFKEIKIYLEDDDKVFKITKEDNIYIIYLFNKKIGKIKKDNKLYKIMVYEEYKIYLNLFGIGIIILLNS